jgi:hypothetical protein
MPGKYRWCPGLSALLAAKVADPAPNSSAAAIAIRSVVDIVILLVCVGTEEDWMCLPPIPDVATPITHF